MINNKGFTLLEVLIAIVVVSIGLLAVAGMQTIAIRGNASASEGTIAIQLAEEMVDRIRLNAGAAPAIYNGLDTNGGTSTTCAGLTAQNDPALGDCIQWRSRLQDVNLGLSNARGQVAVTADSPISKTATITVTVTWGAVSTRTVQFITIMETWLT
ncbi:MAG: type IV pilus modification protein PilV [Deltaproteobacteria bacterium]|nr:type IV pilus modification protein PilV [Deltaproteobacteria bacterium]